MMVLPVTQVDPARNMKYFGLQIIVNNRQALEHYTGFLTTVHMEHSPD
jgi:hypothetical protein